MVKPVNDILETPWAIGGSVEVPKAVPWKQILSHGPGPEWATSQQGKEFITAHAYIACTRRHRTSCQARTANQQSRIVTPCPIDNLADLEQRHGPWPAEVVKA
jgi:hypothetical protein